MGREADVQRRQERQQVFLAAFAQTGIVARASQACGIAASQHYRWLQDDPHYQVAFIKLSESTPAGEYHRPGPKPGSSQGGTRGAEKIKRQTDFLRAISDGLTNREAAEVAGVSLSAHYQWLKSNEKYAIEFCEKYEVAADVRKTRTHTRRRESAREIWADPDRRKRQAEIQRTAWGEEQRSAQAERTRRWMNNPDMRAAWEKANAAGARTPESRANNSQRMKDLWADPEHRERFLQGIQNPDNRKSISESLKRYWASLPEEERKQKMRILRRRFKGGHMLTDIEAVLLLELNDREIPYFTHKEIDVYRVDILIPSLNLIVEADGDWFHGDASRVSHDEKRDKFLRSLGYIVLRLPETEIKAGDFTRLDAEITRLSK